MRAASRPSVNACAMPLVARLRDEASALRLAVSTDPSGACLIDAGASVPGSLEAGRRLAEICLGGLGVVTYVPQGPLTRWPFSVQVQTSDPVTACLASQYAGWSLKDEASGFFALASGPGRAAAAVEDLFAEIAYRDSAEGIVLVLESDRPPPPAVIAEVAAKAGLAPSAVTFIHAPTQSLAGSAQVVARVLEVALHKAHVLGFPLANIVDGMGAAPLAPPSPDFMIAMGRINDAIIYGGRVHLFVAGAEADAAALATALPSTASRDHGAPFADILAAAKGDFYAVDPQLFSPAEVIVTALETGRSFHAGRLAPELVDRSFA